MNQVSSTKKLVGASALMASGTLISRILGMVRVALIAFILGNGTRQVDMLGIATMVPNAIYILFAGGALNTVLVPQIVRAIKNDEDGSEAYTNRIVTAFMIIVAIVAVAATLAAPWVTWVYSADRWRTPELSDQYASMVALTYLTLPQIFFYGVFFLLAQVLNARDKFGPMMWAPIANNLVSIGVLSLYFVIWGNGGDTSAAFTTGQVLVLGIGSTLGIATQALILLPFLKRVGFKLRPRFDLKGTGLGHTFSLTKWTLGFVAVNQLALVVVNRLATTATAGGAGAGVQVYSNAHLIWILPHSLITTSLATAMLPNASRLAAAQQWRGVAQEMMQTIRLALVFIVPSAVAFLALSVPISSVLFAHGSGAEDAPWVGWALMAFSVGLVPFTVQFVCLRTFYALEDTRTPFLLQIGIAGVNALGAILFVWWVSEPSMVAAALAGSYSLAYLCGVFVSWQVLRRRVPDLDGRQIAMHVARLLVGGAPAGLLAWWLMGIISRAIPGFGGTIVGLLIGGVLILGSTFLVGRALRVRGLQALATLLRRRRSPAASAPVPETIEEPGSQDLEATRLDGIVVKNDGETLADQVRREFTRPRAGMEDSEESTDGEDGPPTQIRPRPAVPGTFDPSALAINAEASLPNAAFLSDTPDSDAPDDEHTPMSFTADEDEDTRTEVVPRHEVLGERGMVLGARYQLESRLMARPGSETWRAHDQVLSRDVITHIMPAGAPRTAALLSAARRGAAATDSRFLRVLDVDQTDRGRVGVYVVCEYAQGVPLAAMLRGGLGVKAGAQVVRDVADALSTMHAQGLFHEHLDPDHVLITPGGGVRIIGFGVAPALLDDPLERPWSEREGADVLALAQILRATQSGSFDHSLEPADDLPLSGVWQRVFDGRISTMSELAAALPASENADELEAKFVLAGRVKNPKPDPIELDEEILLEEDVPATEVQESIRPSNRPRYVLWLLVILALIALVVGLLAVAIGGSNRTDGATDAPTDSEPTALTIASATDFDPEADGGNGEENPQTVANTIDGDPATTWTTLRYLRRPDMGGLKPGVGVLLDLGEVRTVASVEVDFVGDGETTVELFASEDGSRRSVEDWRSITPATAAPAGSITITPAEATTTRYLLVYVSELPPIEGGFAAEIAEIRILGS